MAKLYELTEAMERFELKVDEETGEVLNIDDLDALTIARDEKIENVALFIKNLLSDAEAYKREKESFAKKEQTAKKKAESLKEYLKRNLAGEKWDKSSRVSIGFRKSEAVVITDLSLLPDEFKSVEVKPIKALIKERLKQGRDVPGAEIEAREGVTIR